MDILAFVAVVSLVLTAFAAGFTLGNAIGK